MLQPISYITTSAIIKEIETEGSGPLLVLVENGELFYVKSTVSDVPYFEIINEIICGYFAQCWELQVPDFCIANLTPQSIDNFVNEGGRLSLRYEGRSPLKDFFGSKLVPNQIEIDPYLNQALSKTEIRSFNNPIDLLKIGAFDLWIGNKDRRPQNPNILLSVGGNGLFEFCPIDHVAAFAYNEYQQVNDSLLRIEEKNCILSTQLAKSIGSVILKEENIQLLKKDISQCIATTIDNLDFIFEQVPSSWGFSKKSKQHLKLFFSDEIRNKTILEHFLSYIIK